MLKRKSIKLKDSKEFTRVVLERYDEDLQDRTEWSAARLQRYAKLYGWLEPKDYPWPNASNQHVDILMTNSMRTQDTLVNATLKARPIMSAIAVNKGDTAKGKTVDELIDHQLFTEQNGEEKIAQCADSFTNDGRWVCFVPWVKEKRKAREVHPVPLLPPNGDTLSLYNQTLAGLFPQGFIEAKGESLFTITIPTADPNEPEEIKAEFYTEEDRTYILITREKVIFDGPCPIPKLLEDIIVPSRCDNLQPPSPSNPLGADHIIMVDYPSWDEIHRLAKRGYYDLLTPEDLEQMEGRVEGHVGDRHSGTDTDIEQHKIQMDALAGQEHGNAKTTSKIFTRLTYFGRWQVKEDEFEEEVVARFIIGPDRGIKALARLRYLEEEYPRQDLSRPRPFACSPAFIPIPGQWFGMGLPELLEHMRDLSKIILDQMIDKHTLSNTPFGFYRAASGVRPEKINWEPGGLYPLANPQQDIAFPQMPLQDQTIAMNLITWVQQRSEAASMQGALQMGSVPQGKASALRTSSNMMNILQQGDARPERILRRFFNGLAELYQQMHELNKVFLPPNKQYRITGVDQAGDDPYKEVKSPQDIGGMFQFEFKANSLNTSKAIQSQVLTELIPTLANPLTLQMGMTDPEHLYNLLCDLIKSLGQDENRYLKTPPNANIPKLTAEQAMQQMMMGEIPQGLPAEGAQQHLQALDMLQQDPRFAQIVRSDPSFGMIFQQWVQKVQMAMMQEQQQMMAAQQFAGAMGGGQGKTGPEGSVTPGADQMTPQGPGQVMDESMPGAKGMM